MAFGADGLRSISGRGGAGSAEFFESEPSPDLLVRDQVPVEFWYAVGPHARAIL